MWSRWWRKRRGARAYAQEFAELIKAETDPIVSGLRDAHAESIRKDVHALVQTFLEDQRGILENVATASDGKETPTEIRNKELESTLDRLSEFAA